MIELHRKWIEALRSGEYKQGSGQYCSRSYDGTDSYCCLGVLADVAGIEKKYTGTGVVWEDGFDEKGERIWTYCSPNVELVQEKMKLHSHMGYPNDVADVYALWVLNDDRKWTFAEIADYLEQNIDQYVVKEAK